MRSPALAGASGSRCSRRPLLGLVYGDHFRDAAESLLLLLPGAVLFAGSSILNAGIYAAGRPFTATITQLLGMLVTVVGRRLPEQRRGHAAALVSSAPTRVFLAVLIAYKPVSGIPGAGSCPPRASPRIGAEPTGAAGSAELNPPVYRTAFVLHDMEGLSNPEIAEMLEISLPAVKSRVHRSRLFLRQRLEQYFRRG